MPGGLEPRLLAEPAADRLVKELFSENSVTMRQMLKRELRRRLAAILARLGLLDRERLLLRHLEGLSLAECAVALGISEEATKGRYVEVLERLRRLLEGGGRHWEQEGHGG